MNRMTGLILMSIGVLFFLAGALIYNSSKNSKTNSLNFVAAEEPFAHVSTEPVLEKMSTATAQIETPAPEPDNELEKAVEMAIADGVLSNNERKILKEIATRKGLDYKKVIKDVEKQLAESDMESETELVDFRKKQGDDFEKFIVQKFNKKYFSIKEWAGDKYVDGVYAETTTQPDILVEIKVRDKTDIFWVECKWRQNTYNGGIEFATKEQFKRYNQYQQKRKIPIFVAIGLGNKGISPSQLFVVPLDKLKSNFIHLNYLQYFEKEIEDDLYYNMKTCNFN